ncbi:MAG TPA: zf-HC2 domain-containing protein [Ktedonobacteraceae bacterium]|jgi:hypothetical protein|nr:zf-HC2 domain-containing protein [Ktedonobacteraceae bacterium]
MNCEQVKGHLSAYLDNALSFEERQYVASHVECCLRCQHVLADFSHFDALLAQLPRVSPGPDLQERFFSSQEYLELIGTYYGRGSLPESAAYLAPYILPRSVFPPGDRQVHEANAAFLAKMAVYTPSIPQKKKHVFWRPRLFYGIVTVGVLLTFGIGALMSWRRWQERASRTSGATSPLSVPPQHNVQPASTRFLFLRNRTFWCSSPGGVKRSIVRLTTENATAVNGQSVQLTLHERHARSLSAPFATFSQLFHKKTPKFLQQFQRDSV